MDSAGDFIPIKQLREKFNRPRYEIPIDPDDNEGNGGNAWETIDSMCSLVFSFPRWEWIPNQIKSNSIWKFVYFSLKSLFSGCKLLSLDLMQQFCNPSSAGTLSPEVVSIVYPISPEKHSLMMVIQKELISVVASIPLLQWWMLNMALRFKCI